MDTVDQVVENALVSPPSPQQEPEPEPERIDREIPLPDPYRRLHQLILDGYRREIESADESMVLIQSAHRHKQIALSRLRLELVSPVAAQDVHGFTCVWGGSLPGATTLTTDDRPLVCDTLIHLTHPVSPADLLDRESRPKPRRRIYRYRVPGLDDTEWERQNQPLPQPLDPLTWHTLLYQRWVAHHHHPARFQHGAAEDLSNSIL